MHQPPTLTDPRIIAAQLLLDMLLATCPALVIAHVAAYLVQRDDAALHP